MNRITRYDKGSGSRTRFGGVLKRLFHINIYAFEASGQLKMSAGIRDANVAHLVSGAQNPFERGGSLLPVERSSAGDLDRARKTEL